MEEKRRKNKNEREKETPENTTNLGKHSTEKKENQEKKGRIKTSRKLKIKKTAGKLKEQIQKHNENGNEKDERELN